MLKELPDDKSIAPHWGYVLKGKVTYAVADHSELYEAGDVFYVPSGHTPSQYAIGT